MNDVAETGGAAPALNMPVASSADHIGQNTAIEQSRATAEVQSAMVVAQRFPRNQSLALGRIMAACGRQTFAERAFYSYPRGGAQVSDVSVYFAREIARCWGNIQYEIVELSQDTNRGESEVMSYAWDLETNVRSAIRFIVPHYRQTKSGKNRLTDPRDIYEMVANQGSRRVRQCILSIIPDDVVQAAKSACRRTIENGDSGSLSDRIKKCISAFAGLGVTRAHIETNLGCKPESMSLDQLTDLMIVYRTIKGGEPADLFFDMSAKVEAPKAASKPAAKAAAEPEKEKPQEAAKAATSGDTGEQVQRSRGRPSKADIAAAKAAGADAFKAGDSVATVPAEFETPSLKSAWESGWYDAEGDSAPEETDADSQKATDDTPFDMDDGNQTGADFGFGE